MTRLCIVGAGAAGAGAAYALRDADVDVAILEKSRGVCGRAATRRRDDCRYDHGANYVSARDGRTADLLRSLGTDGLETITDPVWVFDRDGEIDSGADRDGQRFTWTDGITQLAKRLLARTDATVERETRVASMAHDGGVWTVTDTDGIHHGPYDGVLLTPPAPQTAALLTETADSDDQLAPIKEATASVPYRTVRTLVFHYPFEQDRPWYGLVNADKDHDVGWLSREECKPGHVPGGESLLVVQMGAEWSVDHYDDDLASVADDVADAVATLVDDARLTEYDWVDDQGWRYALADDGVDAAVAQSVEADGLFVAGDWVVGEARVHAALWNGIDVGERIAETL